MHSMAASHGQSRTSWDDFKVVNTASSPSGPSTHSRHLLEGQATATAHISLPGTYASSSTEQRSANIRNSSVIAAMNHPSGMSGPSVPQPSPQQRSDTPAYTPTKTQQLAPRVVTYTPASEYSSQQNTAQRAEQQQTELQQAPPASPSPALQAMQGKWTVLSSTLRGNAQAAAELLMKQAAATAQLEDLVKQLFSQLQAAHADKVQLEALLAQQHGEFTAQAKALNQHLHAAQTKCAALQVAHESMQAQTRELKSQLESSSHDNLALEQQANKLTSELMKEVEAKTEAKTVVEQQQAQIAELQAQLQELQSSHSDVESSREALQTQLKGMVMAEKELTEHLKHMHGQIEEQLQTLRQQLKAEHSKRLQAVRQKNEMAAKVQELAEQLEHYKAAAVDGGGSSGSRSKGSAPGSSGARPSTAIPLAGRKTAAALRAYKGVKLRPQPSRSTDPPEGRGPLATSTKPATKTKLENNYSPEPRQQAVSVQQALHNAHSAATPDQSEIEGNTPPASPPGLGYSFEETSPSLQPPQAADNPSSSFSTGEPIKLKSVRVVPKADAAGKIGSSRPSTPLVSAAARLSPQTGYSDGSSRRTTAEKPKDLVWMP